MRVTRNTILALAELLAARGPAWRELARQADASAAASAAPRVVLDYSASWREAASRADCPRLRAGELIDFPGYAYTREVSPVSRQPVTVYDPHQPAIWRVPLRLDVVPALGCRRPLAATWCRRAGRKKSASAWRCMASTSRARGSLQRRAASRRFAPHG